MAHVREAENVHAGSDVTLVGKVRYPLRTTINGEARHIWPAIMPGEIEVLPLPAHQCVIQFGDDQHLAINDGPDQEAIIRKGDGRSAIGQKRTAVRRYLRQRRGVGGKVLGRIRPDTDTTSPRACLTTKRVRSWLLFEAAEAVGTRPVLVPADSRLYHAKLTGRDKVVSWMPAEATTVAM